MKKVAILFATGLMFSAASVSAQDVGAPADAPPQDTASDAAAPIDQAAPATPEASFTEDQIQSYAAALVQIQAVSGDATLDDAGKQAKMASIVTEVGLDPQTFNAIGQATQTNPEVRQQVQAAVSTAQSTARSG